MNDDWRLQIDFVADGLDDALLDRLDAQDLEDDLSRAFHDRVIVTRNGTTVFLYAGDREQAEKAQRLVEEFARREDEDLEIDFRRWHPVAQDWKPADQPLPADDAARAAQHRERIAREREEVEEQGYPEYEVGVTLDSGDAAEELADRFREEGLPTVQRWTYVLIGATDEDHANALAARIRGEVPAGAEVVVQGSWKDAYRNISPYSFIGIGR